MDLLHRDDRCVVFLKHAVKALKLFTVVIIIRRQVLFDVSLQCFMMKLYFKVYNFKASSAPAWKMHAAWEV